MWSTVALMKDNVCLPTGETEPLTGRRHRAEPAAAEHCRSGDGARDMCTRDDSVSQVEACDLQMTDERWAFADAHAGAIESHWQRRLVTNPGYFNGTIQLMRSYGIERGVVHATFMRTDFKSFLYWRESGYPPADAHDAFGSAILRGADGAVLLGLQKAGNINAGLAYLPGGFIDTRDVGPSGAIDIGASIARELSEETGLTAAELDIQPGFRVINCGALVSMAREFRSPLPASALRAQILDFLAADPEPELADIVIVRSMSELDPALIPPYTRLALSAVLDRAAG